MFAVCYAGDMRKAEQAVAPLRALGQPIADVVGPHPFAGWQAAFDPLLTPGARNYWKSHDFIDARRRIHPGPDRRGGPPAHPASARSSSAHLGGAINRVPVDATAYPHRDVEFVMNVHTRWRDPAQDAGVHRLGAASSSTPRPRSPPAACT